MTRHDDQQGPRRGQATPCCQQARLLALTRERGEDDGPRRRRRLPALADLEQARVRRDVELQVAFDADLASAGLAQPHRIGFGLCKHGSHALERRP